MNGKSLNGGDAAALSDEREVTLEAPDSGATEVLVFDLASEPTAVRIDLLCRARFQLC